MKKIIQQVLLPAFIAIAFISPLKAQDVKKEMLELTKKFETAYNKKDDKAIQAMHTKNAVRTGADGKTQTGNEEIRAEYERQLKDKVTIKIKHETEVTGAEDGSVTATGTWHVTGNTQKGEKIDITGTYSNALIKENGQWKIIRSLVTQDN